MKIECYKTLHKFLYGVCLSIFFLVSSPVVAVAALSEQELFVKANELYKQGDFVQAYDLYQQIPNKSAQVYYNLGNCAFKRGKLGYALWHWRKAEKQWGIFGREELLNNINLVKNSLQKDKADVSDKGQDVVLSLIERMKSSSLAFMRAVPLLYLQLLFLLIWITLFLYLRYLYKKHQKFIIVFLFTLIAICGSMLAIKCGTKLRLYGVVVHEGAKLLSGPGETYQVLGFLAEGKEGFIYNESSGYYKVKMDSQIGWIKYGELEKI